MKTTILSFFATLLLSLIAGLLGMILGCAQTTLPPQYQPPAWQAPRLGSEPTVYRQPQQPRCPGPNCPN